MATGLDISEATVAWFSLEQIKNISGPVYPRCLADRLPDIFDGKYPEEPIFLYKEG